MKKKITVKWLKQINACADGIEAFKKQCKNPEPTAVIKLCMKRNRFDYANWLICRLFNKHQKVQYAVFAARKVLKIYEDRYPKDKHPREAIEACEAYLKNPCAKTKKAAAAYAAAAYAAAAYTDAATAAYYAAAATAAYAAYATAADAAATAAYAAYAAAYAAAAAAADARDKLKKQIINYGIKLLTS